MPIKGNDIYQVLNDAKNLVRTRKRALNTMGKKAKVRNKLQTEFNLND